jgi:hypothetical protein
MEARDLTTVAATFAPDAQVTSPFTPRLTFKGREQISALTSVILMSSTMSTTPTNWPARDTVSSSLGLGGTDIEIVDHVVCDPDGKIAELTVFFRSCQRPRSRCALSEPDFVDA